MSTFAPCYAITYIICFICQVRGDILTEMVIGEDYGDDIMNEVFIELELEGMNVGCLSMLDTRTEATSAV